MPPPKVTTRSNFGLGSKPLERCAWIGPLNTAPSRYRFVSPSVLRPRQRLPLAKPDNRSRPPGATLRPCTRARRHQWPSLTHPAPCADPLPRPGRAWAKTSNHKKHCRKNLHTAIVAGWRTPRFSAHAPSDQVACPRHDKVPPQHGKCRKKLTCPKARSACKSGVRKARQHALAHGAPG